MNHNTWCEFRNASYLIQVALLIYTQTLQKECTTIHKEYL